MTVDWLRILPDEDYRFHMGLRQGRGVEFFAPSEDAATVRAFRGDLLDEAPEHYAVLPSPAPPALLKAVEWLSTWTGQKFSGPLEAARWCEPDWLVLTPDAEGLLRVAAGVVCFPSSWSLPQKEGLPVSEVHGPVPGLNTSLGRSIDTFLLRLAPDTVWLRDNWGLTGHESLDHHPRHSLPPLTEEASLDTTWLRLEQQLFAKLPGGGVLFAIRVTAHRLDELVSNAGVAPRLARALETMPPEVAAYKGVAAARPGLAELLRAAGSSPSE
jgi:hypothetical protein